MQDVLMNTCKMKKLNKNKGITTGNYGTYLYLGVDYIKQNYHRITVFQ